MAKLSSLIRGYKGDLHRVYRDSCIELSVLVKEDTPVDKGDAKRAWSDNGAPVFGRIYRYENNSDHILPLEYGWSEQARDPDGMLRKNVRNWQSIVEGNL